MDDNLKELGLTGYFISALFTAVAGLSAAVAVQWRQSNKVYGYRLKERDILNKALTDTSANNLVLAEAIRERNVLTSDLVESIQSLVVSNTLLHDRIGVMLDVHSREQLAQVEVIKSLSEAIRTQNGMLVDNRNACANILGGMSDVKANLGVVSSGVSELKMMTRRPR